jgi:ferredoxin-thioredoxin reductase catalytic chain
MCLGARCVRAASIRTLPKSYGIALGSAPAMNMQIYKCCHCLLFVNGEGKPITEYLPEDHVGRLAYGMVPDPTPDKGRPLRSKAADREGERLLRHS